MRKLPLPPPEDDDGSGLQSVIAMYDFTAKEDTDLTIKQVLSQPSAVKVYAVKVCACLMMLIIHPQGEEYIILHKQDQLWWRAQDKHGYIKKKKEEKSRLVMELLKSLTHWKYWFLSKYVCLWIAQIAHL